MFSWKKRCDHNACLEVGTDWTSRCANGECVEAKRPDKDTVLVRDSTDKDGPILKFNREDWKDFLTLVR